MSPAEVIRTEGDLESLTPAYAVPKEVEGAQGAGDDNHYEVYYDPTKNRVLAFNTEEEFHPRLAASLSTEGVTGNSDASLDVEARTRSTFSEQPKAASMLVRAMVRAGQEYGSVPSANGHPPVVELSGVNSVNEDVFRRLQGRVALAGEVSVVHVAGNVVTSESLQAYQAHQEEAPREEELAIAA